MLLQAIRKLLAVNIVSVSIIAVNMIVNTKKKQGAVNMDSKLTAVELFKEKKSRKSSLGGGEHMTLEFLV